MSELLRAGFSMAIVIALSACGGGGGGGGGTVATGIGGPVPSAAQPTPTSAPPSPASGPSAAPSSTPVSAPPTSNPNAPAVIAVPNSLSFQSATGAAQSVTVTQAQNAGSFTISTTTCKGIATVAATTGVGPFAFSPQGAGTCTFFVSGLDGAVATITIVVTTTSLNVQGTGRAQQ